MKPGCSRNFGSMPDFAASATSWKEPLVISYVAIRRCLTPVSFRCPGPARRSNSGPPRDRLQLVLLALLQLHEHQCAREEHEREEHDREPHSGLSLSGEAGRPPAAWSVRERETGRDFRGRSDANLTGQAYHFDGTRGISIWLGGERLDGGGVERAGGRSQPQADHPDSPGDPDALLQHLDLQTPLGGLGDAENRAT